MFIMKQIVESRSSWKSCGTESFFSEEETPRLMRTGTQGNGMHRIGAIEGALENVWS